MINNFKFRDYEKYCTSAFDAGCDIGSAGSNRLQLLCGWREGHQ